MGKREGRDTNGERIMARQTDKEKPKQREEKIYHAKAETKLPNQ